MTPRAILTTLAVLLALTFVGAGVYGVWSYRHMAARVEQLEASAQELTTLKRTVAALDKEAIRRAELTQAIRDARQNAVRAVETVAHENSEAAGYPYQRIPDSVRRAHLDARPHAVPPADRD